MPPSWLPGWWLNFWGWLVAQREALAGLGALATAIGIAAAIVYAYLAWRQARETRRQADITKQIFEASYRPYIELDFSFGSLFNDFEHFRLEYVFKNHGDVPAVLVDWSVSISRDGYPPLERTSAAGWRRTLYPGRDWDLNVTAGGSMVVQGPPPGLTADCMLHYRGPHDSYWTRAILKTSSHGWSLADYDFK